MAKPSDGTKRSSLARRIFIGMASFAVLAMVVFGIAAMTVFYYSYEHDAENRLADQTAQTAERVEGTSTVAAKQYLASLPWSSLRCTLIAKDGTVLYDNQADPASMGNHANRTEVQQAEESGQSSVARYSDTLGVDTVYAAKRLSDGTVVRLAQTRRSLIAFLGGLFLPLTVAAAGIIVVAFVLSRALTQRIMRPINQLDLTRPRENNVYAEMQPLLARIDEQQSELRRQNKELEAAVEARREFSANVSHEMKTPLQVIGGYAELIEAGMVSPEDTRKFAGLIHDEAKSMRTLIDDVLTLSRLDESALGQSEMADVDMAWLAEQVRQRLQSVADERQVTLAVEPASDERPLYVYGSETLLAETLYNLVDNALRYNHPRGSVTVSLAGTTTHQGARVQVWVADTGPGIPPEMRTRVFERFYRLEEGRSRETGGTGLGLAIVKHTVQRYGGSVRIEDNPGGGSVFVIDLPRHEHEAAALRAVDERGDASDSPDARVGRTSARAAGKEAGFRE
jgi:two-component system phosphate regulon sensor histidine kinase PhoR